MGSSCSHSCDANCTSAVVAKDGRLVIVLTTNRFVPYGEELCMDYYSITTSEIEWRAAICLCGMSTCRGSFLHYATQEDLQQVLNQNCGPLWRYASLLRACTNKTVSSNDTNTLLRHGISSAALGRNPSHWISKYAADCLRFVEFERKALPCALMRTSRKDGSADLYTYSAADLDARSVMEQRIQSLVCCFSMIQRVLSKQPPSDGYPLRVLTVSEATDRVWTVLLQIPELMEEYCIKQTKAHSSNNKGSKSTPSAKKAKTSAGSTASTSAEDDGSLVVAARPENISAIENCLAEIRAVLSQKPLGLNGLRNAIVDIRTLISKVQHLSSSKARLNQLCDILSLWANTSNFSVPQAYLPVTSEEVYVVARELGTNIPRNKIFKPEPVSSRRRSGPYASSTTISVPVNNNSVSSSNDIVKLSEPSALSGITSSTSEVAGASKESVKVSSEPESSVSESSAMDTEQENNLHTPAKSQNAVKLEGTDNEPESMVTEDIETPKSNPNSTPSNEVTNPSNNSANVNAPSSGGKSSRAPRDSGILDPNEPVYTGRKGYDAFFVFNQLLGWFNAGTDQAVEIPDLFGCGELPLPSACFGVAELPYNQKQREQLVELLRDLKTQMQPWPVNLKKSFRIEPRSAESMANTLFGSPMLDGALGKIDAVKKVLEDLVGSKLAANSKKNFDFQYDNALPPEAPTAWVQCDDCKKWRRIPWNVDSEELPDEWVCAMNKWDPENANCDAPQDDFDPEVESTVEYSAALTNNPEEYQIGMMKDVYCLQNKVYYEAQIVEIQVKDGVKMLKCHFKGWGKAFDEWVEADSDRIQVHNLFTVPGVKPQDQEKYQGFNRQLELNKEDAAKNSSRRGSSGGKKSSSSSTPKSAAKKSASASAAATLAESAKPTPKKTSTPAAKRAPAAKTPAKASASKAKATPAKRSVDESIEEEQPLSMDAPVSAPSRAPTSMHDEHLDFDLIGNDDADFDAMK